MSRDEGRGTRDKGRGTRDKGQGTRDEGRGTRDEGQVEGNQVIGNRYSVTHLPLSSCAWLSAVIRMKIPQVQILKYTVIVLYGMSKSPMRYLM